MNFSRGEILFDPAFVYPDANISCDKYLLILNKSYSYPDNVVFVPATTQRDENLYKPNCNEKDGIFYFDRQIGFYKQKTILQLFLINILEIEFLEEMIEKKGIRKLSEKTSQEEIGRIINCLKQMKDDISQEIQDLIF